MLNNPFAVPFHGNGNSQPNRLSGSRTPLPPVPTPTMSERDVQDMLDRGFTMAEIEQIQAGGDLERINLNRMQRIQQGESAREGMRRSGRSPAEIDRILKQAGAY